MLEAQVRALQESLGAARSGQSTLAAQLADAKSAADSLRQDRDRLQRQNNELSEKLQAQVGVQGLQWRTGRPGVAVASGLEAKPLMQRRVHTNKCRVGCLSFSCRVRIG